MAQKPTPEEQLLKLIEGNEAGKQAAPAGAQPQKAEASSSKSFTTVKKLPGFLDYFKLNFLGKSGKFDMAVLTDVRNVNRTLITMVVVSILYLFIDLLVFKPGDAQFLSQVGTSDAVYPLTAGAMGTNTTDLSVYKESLRKRNPFGAPQSSSSTAGTETAGAGGAPLPMANASGPLNELLQGFKLVGISVSDHSLAMIEEVSTGRTYFLRKGQELKGMKIQEVDREKVTVTYEGQEADLF